MKKAILINVNEQTITEVQVVQDSKGSYLKSIYNHLGCQLFNIVNINSKNDVYVDDEGLLNLTEESMFFRLKGYPQPLAGNGLVMGYNPEDGESIDTTMTIEQVKETIVFMNVRDAIRYQSL